MPNHDPIPDIHHRLGSIEEKLDKLIEHKGYMMSEAKTHAVLYSLVVSALVGFLFKALI